MLWFLSSLAKSFGYPSPMGARTLVTFEQFEQYPDDGMKHELIQGEHTVVPPPKFRHTRVQQKLQDALRQFVHSHRLGEIYIEAGFKLSSDTFLQPDVGFVGSSQLDATDPDGYLGGAPAIAIEVLSESNTPAKIAKKTNLYLAHGSQEVWIVDPSRREVPIQRPDGASQTVAAGELRSDVVPGWSIHVESLFER